MINLLPEKFKKEIRLIFVYRRIIVIFTFFVLVLLLFSGFLYFLRNLLLEKSQFFQTMVDDKQKKMETTQLKEFRNLIQEENKQLGNVEQIFSGQIYFYPMMEKLFSLVPDKIYIKSISLQKKGTFNERSSKKAGSQEGVTQLTINGFCSERDVLISFLETLKSDTLLKNIDMPSSVLLKQNNIDFSISFIMLSSE